RHQIQRGADHHVSGSVSAPGSVGVTALQLRTLMSSNYQRYVRIARRDEDPPPPGWVRGPVAWEPAIVRAIVPPSPISAGIVASGGARRAGDVNALRTCFDPRTLVPTNCGTNDVRLDVENQGHNLRA